MLIHRCLAVTCRSIAAGAILATSLLSSAQFVGNNPQAVEKRVDDLVANMTLDEKIALMGGDTPFRTHPISRLDIPFFQMADGPVGAHIPAPTIAYAAGIGLAASWDTALALRVGQQLGRDAFTRRGLSPRSRRQHLSRPDERPQL